MPPVVFLWGGICKGSLNLGAFVLIISVLMFYPNNECLGIAYTFEFKSRLLYSFLTVLGLFIFYKYVRKFHFVNSKK